MMKSWIVGALALGMTGAGCAVLPPPEPCTQAWYDYEARQAFLPVRRDFRRALNRLQEAQAALESPEPGIGAAVRITFAAESGLRVLEGLEQESLPRLRLAAETCNNPSLVRRAVFDFLEEEGIDDLLAEQGSFASLIGLSGQLERMIAAYEPGA